MGFCNFYQHFIKEYGRIARPLTILTRKSTSYKWTKECQKAFDHLKQAMLEAPILYHYDHKWPTRVETDASDGVVAGVLSQQDLQTHFWHPIAYFSKTMQPAELNYDIYDKEILAIILSFKAW